MFSKASLGGGGRGSGARVTDGPTPIPRDEKLQLRGAFERTTEEDSAAVGTTSLDDAEATRSLLFLSSGSMNGGTKSATASAGQSSSNAANGAPKNERNGGNNAPASCESWFGQALEYAAGVALRTNVLQPALLEKSLNDISPSMRAGAPRFLGSYSSGNVLLFKDLKSNSTIKEASVQRINHQDAAVLAAWWERDKVLSYTSPEWSDWWVRRCHSLDPGCEMLKFVEKRGKILGVVYLERNIVDHHPLQNGESTRTTLMRGIRLAPSVNPEVSRRSGLTDCDTTPDVQYKGIASLLFCHVLFLSVRYGSQCVGLYSPKSEVAERFYESFLGKPIARHEADGRRYYRMEWDARWTTLQKAFRRQLLLWIERELGDKSTPSEEENSPTESTVEDGTPGEQDGDKDGEGDTPQDAKRRRVEEPSFERGDDDSKTEESNGGEYSI